ncbi:hypothetical protein [Nocardiopsis protaetiae]|uniref:hypothetical protein n=1 Tax=Nocardiopsis protaetiae TaxID=3382270 RepID=UPI00387B06F3
MSESLYDFRAALSGEPEVPVEDGEEQEAVTVLATAQESTSGGGQGVGAPLSLNLATGLLTMTNRSGTVEADALSGEVTLDPDVPGGVGRRDGFLVMGATAEGSPLVAGMRVQGEILTPVDGAVGVPASVEGSTEGVVTEPVAAEPLVAESPATPLEPVHVVSVREPGEGDSQGDLRGGFTEMLPAQEGVPVSAPIEAVPISAPAEIGEAAEALGPIVTVDPKTGETVILAEDLKITVGPEAGLVKVEPSGQNVPLDPDAEPITVEAGGLSMVIDPATGTLEVNPIKGEFADVTVEIGDVRIVTDGETGEVTVDPGEGTVSVDPETGLITVEPPAAEEDGETGQDGEDGEDGEDGDRDEEGSESGEGGGGTGDGDTDGGGADGGGDTGGDGGKGEPDPEEDREAPGGGGGDGRPGEDSDDGDTGDGNTGGGDTGGEKGDSSEYNPIDGDGMYGPAPQVPEQNGGERVTDPVPDPRPDPEGDGSGGPSGDRTGSGGEGGESGGGDESGEGDGSYAEDPITGDGMYGPAPEVPEDPPVQSRLVNPDDTDGTGDRPGEEQGEPDPEPVVTPVGDDQGGGGGGGGGDDSFAFDPITGEGMYGPAPDPVVTKPKPTTTDTTGGGQTGGGGGGGGGGGSAGDEEDEGEKKDDEDDDEDDKGDGDDEDDKEKPGDDDKGGGNGGDGSGGGSGGSGSKEGEGTKIDVPRLRSFQQEYVGTLNTDLGTHITNFSDFEGAGTGDKGANVVLLGNPALLKSASDLTGRIDRSMASLYSIMKKFRKELDEITDQLEININVFEELEEDQVLNAGQVVYLIGSPPGATGGGGGSTTP